MTARYIIAATMLLSACCLSAGTVPFRCGEITAAQISAVQPEIINCDPLVLRCDTDFPVFAAVTFIPDPGRTFSIDDFTLEIVESYSCVAIACGQSAFSGSAEPVTAGPGESVTLLFAVDARRISSAAKDNRIAMRLCSPNVRDSISFELLGNSPLTSPAEIPVSGNFPD